MSLCVLFAFLRSKSHHIRHEQSDVMKVRVQTNVGGVGGKGWVQSFQAAVRSDGPSVLFRGWFPPVFAQIFVNAAVFASYETGIRLFDPRDVPDRESASLKTIYCAGCFSGIVQAFVLSPL